MTLDLNLYLYMGCAVAGVVFHWITTGKNDADRPTAVQWLLRHYMYVLGSLGLTLASALFFMPEVLDMNARVAAIAFGVSGGSAIKNLFIR